MLDDPKPEIRDRQDRFLSRMLESSVSLHKQDEGKDERTSQSARTVFQSTANPRALAMTPLTGIRFTASVKRPLSAVSRIVPVGGKELLRFFGNAVFEVPPSGGLGFGERRLLPIQLMALNVVQDFGRHKVLA